MYPGAPLSALQGEEFLVYPAPQLTDDIYLVYTASHQVTLIQSRAEHRGAQR